MLVRNRQFRETWSIRRTFKWFHAQGIELPVTRKRDGRVEVVFQLPTHSFIGHGLRNPIYAGAYVHGPRPGDRGLELLGTRKRAGRGEVVFQLPAHSFIGHVLRSPSYAGAYVYGRRPVE